MDDRNEPINVAVFGGGCFWCTEAVFNELKGILSATPGYAGGKREHPSYEDVSTGTTGHAEAVRIEFDPSQISYNDLLAVFFATHDPTTPRRQGNDVGPQYRSAIFYADEAQKKAAAAYIETLNKSTREGEPVVTELLSLAENPFYEAEDYHHDYYRKNASAPYCEIVIAPKLEKARKEFANLLRTHAK